MAIQNPLGSGGFNTIPLGNLTAGLEALQKTEIEKRLREINQNKQWQHDKDLSNEKWALDSAMPQQNDDVRIKNQNDFIKAEKEATDYQTKLIKEVGGAGKLSLEQRLDIQNRFGEVKRMVKQGEVFANAHSAWQKMVIAQRAAIEDPEQLKEFDAQIANASRAISDPNQSPDQSIFIESLTPLPPSASAIMGQWEASLTDKVKYAIEEGRKTGTNKIDENGIRETIDAVIGVDNPNMPRVTKRGTYGSDENAVKENLFQRIKNTIPRDVIPNVPSGYGRGGVNVAKLPRVDIVEQKNPDGTVNNVINFPQNISRVVKEYDVGDAIDPITGKEIPINKSVDLRFISINKEKGTIRAELKGKPLKNNGNPIYVTGEDIGSSLKVKIENSTTEESLNKDALSILAPQSEKPDNWSNVTGVGFTPNQDGSYTLTGTLNRYPWGLGLGKRSKGYKPKENEKPEETEVVSKTYYPVIDESKSQTIDLPMEEWANTTGILDKYSPDGKQTIREYLGSESPAKTEAKQKEKNSWVIPDKNDSSGLAEIKKEVSKLLKDFNEVTGRNDITIADDGTITAGGGSWDMTFTSDMKELRELVDDIKKSRAKTTKPKTVVQDGITYTLNETTGEYE